MTNQGLRARASPCQGLHVLLTLLTDSRTRVTSLSLSAPGGRFTLVLSKHCFRGSLYCEPRLLYSSVSNVCLYGVFLRPLPIWIAVVRASLNRKALVMIHAWLSLKRTA